MKLILFILTVILVFGCIGQTSPVANNSQDAPVNPQPPTQNPPQPSNELQTCEEYCHTSTSISCNGSWIISGTYPNCDCQFNCVIISDEPIEFPQLPSEPQTEQAANFSLMLESSMNKINTEFYSMHSGMFTEKSHKWKRSITGSSDSITFAPHEVKFNGASINSLQASGYFTFEGASSKDIIGTAIFNEETTPLDSYGFIGEFDVEYIPTLIKGTLTDCKIYNKEYAYSGVIYYFECENEELN
ncbi:MAG: hypothetical protein ABID61_03455 [Candidatus Micrarchaeota archaeon]